MNEQEIGVDPLLVAMDYWITSYDFFQGAGVQTSCDNMWMVVSNSVKLKHL